MTDWNHILREHGYHKRKDFGEIVKFAIGLEEVSKEDVASILDHLEYNFNVVPLLTMGESRSYNTFGQDLIEPNAREQMDRVMSIPPAVSGALMPDAHLGYGMPIGGVAILDNAISPNFVGYDIACRMKLTIFAGVTPDDIDDDAWLSAMRQSTRFGVGSHWKGKDKRDHDLMDDHRFKLLDYDMDRVRSQLGTSGKGNHFLDVVVIHDYLGSPNMGDLMVGFLTHSGSRGPGYQTARKYNKMAEEYTNSIAYDIPKGYEWLSMDTDQGREYFMAMNLMGEYAQASHDLIHESFMNILGLGAWNTYDNHHNFAWRIPGTDHYIHRKGATPAHKDEVGLIPGSSGSASYIVRGLGLEEGLNSAPHGAGRPYSRTEAKKHHEVEVFKEHMETQDIRHKGITGDETVFAYKDIEAVMEASEPLVEPIARMFPRIVLMGGGGR